MNERIPTDDSIREWVRERLGDEVEIERLPGDVSVRTYARIVAANGHRAILSFCPPALRESCERFLRSTELLRSVGIRTAEVLAADADEGWILLEDLGPSTVFDLGLPEAAREAYYRDGLATIGKLQSIDPETVRALCPNLDHDALRTELDQTWHLFLAPTGVAGGPELAKRLERALNELCDRIGGDDLVPAHRDFMVRNLMPIDPERSAVIDHQDLRLAPRFYDLASLLNDSLFVSPELESTLLAEAGVSDRIADYRRAVLQRTLKAIGTFVAFSKRGNSRYLPLIGPTLSRAADQLAAIPETASLAEALIPRWRNRSASDLLE